MVSNPLKTIREKIVIKRVPDLPHQILKLGGEGLLECYQCGSCTAICPISEDFSVSFRTTIKYAQLGLVDKLVSDVTPWLCNVHGDCTDSCPRDAKPSVILASIRRYQSFHYDWTGISRWWNFSSLKAKVAVVLITGLLTALGLLTIYGSILANYRAIGNFVNVYELTIPIAAILIFSFGMLFSNAYRMYKFVGGGKDYKVGFFSAIRSIMKVWLTTENEAMKHPEKRSRILEHILILIGLGIFIVLSVIGIISPYVYSYLPATQVLQYPLSQIIKYGRYAGAGLLLIGSGLPLTKRLIGSSKRHWYYRYFTHSTDWISLIMVFAVALTALGLVVFSDLGMANLAYIAFIAHLSVVVPFLLFEVPFGKHNHWIYKGIANYVSARKGIIRGE